MRPWGKIALFLAASVLAQGQFFLPETPFLRLAKPKKAVVADITATFTARTPWGEFRQVEAGKYWRDKKGHIRQDNAHGFSAIIDLGRSRTLIDTNADLIVQDKPSPSLSTDPPRLEPSVLAVFMQGAWTKAGTSVVEGYAVTIHRAEPFGQPIEVWFAKELNFIVLIRYATETTVFEQKYHNIRVEEPKSSIFEIPPGMRIVTSSSTASWSPAGLPCLSVTYGTSGEKERKKYAYGAEWGCK